MCAFGYEVLHPSMWQTWWSFFEILHNYFCTTVFEIIVQLQLSYE